MRIAGVTNLETTSRIFWQSLERALGIQVEFKLFGAGSTVDLDGILKEWEPQVLVIEEGPQLDINYDAYLKEHSKLTIIGIDSKSTDMILRMRDIGLGMLAKLIHTVSKAPNSDAESSQERLQLIRADFPPRLVAEWHVEETTPVPSFASRELADELNWVDVCLHERLAQESGSDGHSNVPGWSMSAAQARTLLSRELQNASIDQLQSLKVKYEQTAFAVKSPPSVFQVVCDAFGLEPMDRRVLLLTIAPELDGRFARVFGYLNDNLSRQRPSATLLSQLVFPETGLAWDLRARLTVEHPLGRYRLVSMDAGDSLPGSEAMLTPARDVVSFMHKQASPSTEYGPTITVVPPSRTKGDSDHMSESLRSRLQHWREGTRNSHDGSWVQLEGDVGARDWFVNWLSGRGMTQVVFDLSAAESLDPAGLEESCYQAARIAVLYGAVLLVVGRGNLTKGRREWFDARLLGMLRELAPRMAVHAEGGWIHSSVPSIQLERPRLGRFERAAAWRQSASAQGITLSHEESIQLASTLNLTESEIETAVGQCDPETADRIQLQAAARAIVRTGVPSSIRRIDATFDWKDIVLPSDLAEQLRSIPEQVRHGGRVLEEWDFQHRMPYGHGVAALFSGPSGTGKTMAAQIIARELGVELFQVDLANTISKYIGETEKNLDGVFDAAEKSSAVLLFDEADALFGKRTEVRDAHDRYANVEVAYLLQRMEAYSGLAILTTNQRQNMDNAFLRRLRLVLEFPTPGARDRETIWRRVFPSRAPVADDVNFTLLARQLNLTGGHIQQIAIRAAFSAAAETGRIEMRHVVRAAREELRKLGMVNAEKSLAVLAA